MTTIGSISPIPSVDGLRHADHKGSVRKQFSEHVRERGSGGEPSVRTSSSPSLPLAEQQRERALGMLFGSLNLSAKKEKSSASSRLGNSKSSSAAEQSNTTTQGSAGAASDLSRSQLEALEARLKYLRTASQRSHNVGSDKLIPPSTSDDESPPPPLEYEGDAMSGGRQQQPHPASRPAKRGLSGSAALGNRAPKGNASESSRSHSAVTVTSTYTVDPQEGVAGGESLYGGDGEPVPSTHLTESASTKYIPTSSGMARRPSDGGGGGMVEKRPITIRVPVTLFPRSSSSASASRAASLLKRITPTSSTLGSASHNLEKAIDSAGGLLRSMSGRSALSETATPTASAFLRALSATSSARDRPRSREKTATVTASISRMASSVISPPPQEENEVDDMDEGGPTDDNPFGRSRSHLSHRHPEMDSATDLLIIEDTADGNCLSQRSLSHARSISGYIPPAKYLPPVFVEQYAEVLAIVDKYASMYHRQLLAERLDHESEIRSEKAWAAMGSRSASQRGDRSMEGFTGANSSREDSVMMDTGSPLRHVQAIMAADAANSQVQLLKLHLDDLTRQLEDKQRELDEMVDSVGQSEAAVRRAMANKTLELAAYKQSMEGKLQVVVAQGEALLEEHQELEHVLIELEERAVNAEERLEIIQGEFSNFRDSVSAIPADEFEPTVTVDRGIATDEEVATPPRVKDLRRQVRKIAVAIKGEADLPSPQKLGTFSVDALVRGLAAAHGEVVRWRMEAHGWKKRFHAAEDEALQLLAEQEQRNEAMRQEQQQERDAEEMARPSTPARSASFEDDTNENYSSYDVGGSEHGWTGDERQKTHLLMAAAEEQIRTRELLLREIELEKQKRERFLSGQRVIELPPTVVHQPPRLVLNASSPTPPAPSSLARAEQRYEPENDDVAASPHYSSRAFFDDPIYAMALMEESDEREHKRRMLAKAAATAKEDSTDTPSRRVHFSPKQRPTTPSGTPFLQHESLDFAPGSGLTYPEFMERLVNREASLLAEAELDKPGGMTNKELANYLRHDEADRNRRITTGIPSSLVDPLVKQIARDNSHY